MTAADGSLNRSTSRYAGDVDILSAAPDTASLEAEVCFSTEKQTMILAFETKPLRTLCEDPDVAVTTLGPELALQLRGRLADLRAATSIADLLVGNPRLEGSSADILRIDLQPERVMVWTPNHVTIKTLPDKRVDWQQVSRIRLLRIEGADNE